MRALLGLGFLQNGSKIRSGAAPACQPWSISPCDVDGARLVSLRQCDRSARGPRARFPFAEWSESPLAPRPFAVSAKLCKRSERYDPNRVPRHAKAPPHHPNPCIAGLCRRLENFCRRPVAIAAALSDTPLVAGAERLWRGAGGRSSGVEHNLAKVGVVGSNPIARSRFSKRYNDLFDCRQALVCLDDVSSSPV